jgi:hypothetical protein
MDITPPSKDTIRENWLKRKIQHSAAYRRPISLTETSTGLGERMEENLSSQCPLKTGRISNTYLRQIRLQTYIDQMRQGRSLHTNKKWIHQKEITIINLYAPNVSAPNFIKHTLKDLKAYIDSNTVVMGNFNIPLSPIDRSSKQKISKEILELNHTIDQMDLADV